MWGVSEEPLTTAAYDGGPVLCEDNLAFTVGTLCASIGVVCMDGVPGPGGVVPGGGGGGEGGGDAALWF